VSFAIIIFYYAIIAARQNKFDTHIDANASTKRQKNIKTVQSNRVGVRVEFNAPLDTV